MKQKIEFGRRACLDVHSPIYLRTETSRFCGGVIADIYKLVDKASRAGFSFLQFNPVQDTAKNACPYMGVSIFSYSPIYLSLSHMEHDLETSEIKNDLYQKVVGHKLDRVSYGLLYQYKLMVLRSVFDRGNYNDKIDLSSYDKNVLDYAVFVALKHKLHLCWSNWPRIYKTGDSQGILAAKPDLHREVKFNLFVQDQLQKQWLALVNYGRAKGIDFIFDKPIYPIHDSAEVWANQQLFYLKPDGSLKHASGCDNPKDPFGAQYWGHAVYKYKEKPREVVDYYLDSIRSMSKIAKVIRLDHALALVWKYYIMKPKSDSGRHRPALKARLFNRIIENFPDVFFIAEDLGYNSKRHVSEPLDKHNIPGMRSLQWCQIPKYAKLAAYPELCVAMTSNHDLASLPAWWHRLRESRKKIFYRQFDETPAAVFDEQIWQLVELVFSSKALLAAVTLRDLAFDLRQYNRPGIKNSQNWTSRMHKPLEEIDFSRIEKIINGSLRGNS